MLGVKPIEKRPDNAYKVSRPKRGTFRYPLPSMSSKPHNPPGNKIVISQNASVDKVLEVVGDNRFLLTVAAAKLVRSEGDYGGRPTVGKSLQNIGVTDTILHRSQQCVSAVASSKALLYPPNDSANLLYESDHR